jgi:sortase A
MNKRWQQGLISSILVAILVVLGLYLAQDAIAAWVVRHNTVTVTKVTVKAAIKKQKPTYDFDQVKPLSLASLSAAAVSKHDVAAVGKLVIPELSLNLPIVLGVGNAQLAFAAGTLNAGQEMGQGNYALAGHHMANDETVLFGPLVKSQVGMQVYVSDMSQVYVYQVYARHYIKATAVSILNATAQPELTLVTCDDDGTGRLAIQARLTATAKLSEVPKPLQALIEKNV